jgi:hypothetical protein
MNPLDNRTGRLQRNSAPQPLKLASPPLQDNGIDPKGGMLQSRIDEHPHPAKSQPNQVNHSFFSSSFNFAAGGAAPSPPPSAGLPAHPRSRGPRSKSPSARNSMIEDEESEWDMTKELPHFQATIRRPSLLTPPQTSDSRRQSYDRSTHLGYDDGSTEEIAQGRRSSVPTHHLRPDPSPERQSHAGFRRSSLATTSVTRQDVEDAAKASEVDVLSEVDSAEEDLAADSPELSTVETQTAEMKLEDKEPAVVTPAKRESEEADPTVHSELHTAIPNPFAAMKEIPYTYVLKRLLDLGPYFVGDEATAQVFVQAVPMNEKDQVYKVDVIPKDTEAGPFRLVKRYKYSDFGEEDDATPPPDSPTAPAESSDYDDDEDQVEYTSPCLPVHVEYAVFRLPLLGTMLLSGQVFCGDTLQIPLPYPEVWTAVVGWMYTNKVVRLPGLNIHEQAEMVRDCIEFLGGRV